MALGRSHFRPKGGILQCVLSQAKSPSKARVCEAIPTYSANKWAGIGSSSPKVVKEIFGKNEPALPKEK